MPADERGEILEELRTTRDIRVALNLAWMPLTPQKLVEDLWTKPAPPRGGGARAVPPRPRAAAARAGRAVDAPPTSRCSTRPPSCSARTTRPPAPQARADAERRTAEVEYARRVLQSSGNAGLVSAELLADRFADAPVRRLTTAERAAADRTWTYGHVVVDEAQELSAMAWRMLLRRVPDALDDDRRRRRADHRDAPAPSSWRAHARPGAAQRRGGCPS